MRTRRRRRRTRKSRWGRARRGLPPVGWVLCADKCCARALSTWWAVRHLATPHPNSGCPLPATTATHHCCHPPPLTTDPGPQGEAGCGCWRRNHQAHPEALQVPHPGAGGRGDGVAARLHGRQPLPGAARSHHHGACGLPRSDLLSAQCTQRTQPPAAVPALHTTGEEGRSRPECGVGRGRLCRLGPAPQGPPDGGRQGGALGGGGGGAPGMVVRGRLGWLCGRLERNLFFPEVWLDPNPILTHALPCTATPPGQDGHAAAVWQRQRVRRGARHDRGGGGQQGAEAGAARQGV